MTMRKDFQVQPGWDTPVVVDYRKPSVISWFMGLFRADRGCLALKQGRCPGRNLCHDCSWSEGDAGPQR